MKDQAKKELAHCVKLEIGRGKTMVEVVRKLSKLGFTEGTIRAYYRAFNPQPQKPSSSLGVDNGKPGTSKERPPEYRGTYKAGYSSKEKVEVREEPK